MKDKLVILSGAGISAESGLKTFRDADGLWEGHDVMEVASVEGWRRNPSLVLDFYNARRRQLKEVFPNEAHKLCAQLEEHYDTVVITQNVDNLHERAGSKHIIHLHGQLTQMKSEIDDSYSVRIEEDIAIGELCPKGGQMRPDIVWFGESVPTMEDAVLEISDADIILIIGTSMQVYPAAGLIGYAPRDARLFYIDPKPSINFELSLRTNLDVIEKTAIEGMKLFYEKIIS